MDFDNLIHTGIMDGDRWINQPLNRQIGNIGSEVSRLVHRKQKGNLEAVFPSLERALELIDLTVYGLQKKNESAKMRELLRFREVLCDCTLDTGYYGVLGEHLVEYCTQFMLIG